MLFIILMLTIVTCEVLIIKNFKKPRSESKPPSLKISDIETLLYNIEIYDGTSKGQRRCKK